MRSEAAADRTRFAPRLVGSLLGHGLVVLLLFFWPTSAPPALPAVVTVDLVAAIPNAPRPAPARPAPVAKPKPVQKKVVLPKQAPALKPKPKPRPAQRPAKVQRPRRKPATEELEYEDALDLLRQELGEERPPDEPAEEPTAAAEPSPGAATASPEWVAWQSAARRHVRARWVTPGEFLDRSLSTVLSVQLSADGRVVGSPKVRQSSGDPFWDDNTVRAIVSASPLPPPPSAGEWTFVFTPEERF